MKSFMRKDLRKVLRLDLSGVLSLPQYASSLYNPSLAVPSIQTTQCTKSMKEPSELAAHYLSDIEFAKRRIDEINEYINEVDRWPDSDRKMEILISAYKLLQNWYWVKIGLIIDGQ